VLLVGAVGVFALAQGALRQFTQWVWIEHPTFQSRSGVFTTELLPPQEKPNSCNFLKRSKCECTIFGKIFQKPFLQCLAPRRSFSGSRVIADKPAERSIYRLLRSREMFRISSAVLGLLSAFFRSHKIFTPQIPVILNCLHRISLFHFRRKCITNNLKSFKKYKSL